MRLPHTMTAVVLLVLACDTPHPLEPGFPRDPSLRSDQAAGHLSVLTRNMYVGTPLDAILAETNPNLIPLRVAEAWATIQATDAPGRIGAMADEIARERPHVVGLQEVSLLRTQTPSDFVLGNVVPNAADVALDFQTMLLAVLDARGARYQVAAFVENSDVELPMLVDPAGPSFTDVRLTDFDVLLVRTDVGVANPAAANYGATLPIPPLIEIRRGWTAADLTVEGVTYHVVNTHLEAEVALVRNLQAQELVGLLGGQGLPTVMLGDFNSGPGGDPDAYGFLLTSGFNDAWLARPGLRGAGFTCCQAGDLTNDVSVLHERVDLILFRNFLGLGPASGLNLVQLELLGDEPRDRIFPGLWPSDHAGVVGQFVVPQARRTVVD